jgi:ectoine hydroxylase-related dioxygenase (phytanoyl-CoA dioxygenase family)
MRALFHGRPIFDPESADLRDRAGDPLDVTRRFALDELRTDPSEARHFLSTAGYIHVAGVFDAGEVSELRREADVLEGEARPGDDASWWGRNADGDQVLTRVLRAASRPRLRALHDDARVHLVVATAPEELKARTTTGDDAVTVLWKRPDMTEGLADLPWHRDCGMGGHALNCPTTIMTICLTDGRAEAGELRVLPGSHVGSYPFVDGTDTRAPRGVSVGVSAGDVTLHYSDVMHASMPPTSAEGPHRISILMAFVPSTAGHHRGDRHYNDALLGDEDGQIEHLGRKLSD